MKKILIVNLICLSSFFCFGQDSLQSFKYEDLVEIVNAGDTTALEKALSGKILNPIINPDDNVPLLFYACASRIEGEKGLDIIKFLLSKGANPNIAIRYGTPAHWAMERGNLDRLSLLLDYGFNPRIEEMKYWVEKNESENSQVPEWMTQIITELEAKGTDFTNYPYLEYVDPSDPLLLSAAIFYCKDARYTVAKRIISCKVNIDLIDKNGMTALLHSVYNLNTSAVSFLIENNADVNLPLYSPRLYESQSKIIFNDNLTPLHLLLYKIKENPKLLENKLDQILLIIKMLKKANADLNARTKHEKKTVLVVAKEIKNKEIIRTLNDKN